MELRTVGVHEVDLIEDLFQETYNREQGIKYWKWCFENPYGYLNTGIFDKNRLVCYHAFPLTETSAFSTSVMTHPNYRRQGLFMKTSVDIMERLSLLRDYVYLFSNEMIRSIHIEKEKYIEVYQIREYRIPFDHDLIYPLKNNFPEFTEYTLWRYRNHPLIKYIFHFDMDCNAIYSLYEDRVQIINYDGSRHEALQVANYIAYAHKKEIISFWSEISWDYPSILIPTWKQYKILNPLNIDMDSIMKIDKLRMGQSDVF